MVKTKIKPIGIKMPNFQKWNLYTIFFILSFTGLWWISLHEILMSKDLRFMHRLITIHGIAALCCSIIFGSIMTQHIRLAWQTQRNQWSGGITFLFLLIITITGLGLYYANEEQHDIFKWIHIIIGLFIIALLPIHIILGRRKLNRSKK